MIVSGQDLLEFEVDPLFRKTSASFDQSTQQGMLLNVAKIGTKLIIAAFLDDTSTSACGDMIPEGKAVVDGEHAFLSREIVKKIQNDIEVFTSNADKLELIPELLEFKGFIR